MSACKPGRVAGPRPADVDAQGLPRTVPPRRAAGEPSLAPLVIKEVGARLLVDRVPAGFSGEFPLERGVMVSEPDVPVGTRYMVFRPAGTGTATVRVGEVERTAETCPPASDGTRLHCLRCSDEAPASTFATWVEPPVLTGIERSHELLYIGPVTPENRAALAGARVRATDVGEVRLVGTWWSRLQLDLGGDGRIDLVEVYNDCPDEDAADPRCAAAETWRLDAGTWWASEWTRRSEWVRPPPYGPEVLQVFDVYVNPALHPDERHTHDVGIMEFMNHRPPRTGSAYLLVDGRDPLALVTQTVRPDEVAPRFPHPLQRAPRRSLFAIGPVEGTWEELRGARVRTDYGEDARVLGLAYGPEDRERVVVAVDLDADGRDELQLLASGALDLGWKERDPLVRFDLWVDDGHQRRRSEWMLYWSARPRVIMRYECSTGVERTP